MRTNVFRVLLFTLALGTAVFSARADDKADRKEIQAFFDRSVKLSERKDVEGMTKLMSPDAFLLMPDGTKLSVKEWASMSKNAMGQIVNIKTKQTLDKLTVKGKQAVAVITETNDFGMVKDKGHKYREVSKQTITLMKTAKGWLASKIEYASDALTRDGKPFNPQVPK